jgi:hypothetical protein
MARPKPYYEDLAELEAFLVKEGFERQPLGAMWKCDMTGEGDEPDVYVLVEGAAPKGYRIKEL